MKQVRKSLIGKIASGSVLNIMLVCTIIIAMGATTLSVSMTEGIKTEMALNASVTALKVDQMFSSVLASTYDLKFAADEALADPDVLIKALGVYSAVAEKQRISLPLHDFEVYAAKSITNALAYHGDDLSGMGVIFEPNGFWPEVEDYSFYFTHGMEEEDMGLFLPYAELSTLDYYQGTKVSEGIHITPPYYEGDTLVVTISMPIFTQIGNFVGIVGADVAVDRMSNFVVTDPAYPTMATTLLDQDLNIAYTSRPNKQIGDAMSSIIPDAKDLAEIDRLIQTKAPFEVEIHDSQAGKVVRFFRPVHIGEHTWWAVTTISNSDLNNTTINSVIQLVLVSLVLQILSVFFQVGYLKKTLAPIKQVVSAALELARGEFQTDIQLKTGDELETLGNAFGEMTAHLREIVYDIHRVLREVSEKNLAVAPQANYVGEFAEIEDSMNSIVDTMNLMIAEMTVSAQQVAQGAGNVTGGSQMLSDGATRQAQSIQALSGQVTDISDKITENADHATKAKEIFAHLVEDIQEGNRKMADMRLAMDDITGSAVEIEKIMKTINDIASQTNLLALNASVEAVRAGVAGKGFAVVAGEVKNLANKSGEAAKTTATLIQNSIDVIQRGAQLAQSAQGSLSEIIEQANQTTELIEDIAVASGLQADAIYGVTEGIEDITGVVQSNTSTAVESATASQQLLAQSESLQGMVRAFKLRS